MRVVIASAAFPKYDRNLNTGGDNEPATSWSGSGFCMTERIRRSCGCRSFHARV